MAIYGPDSVNEAKRIKGQEYDSIIYSRDGSGKKIDDSNIGAGIRFSTTSNGKGGVLDSVAQNHIKDLDVEKEKALLKSEDFLNEYNLYISGQIEKAIKQYGDQTKSQLEDRMVEDLERLKPYFPDTKQQFELIADEYYGGKLISKDIDDEEKARILKSILRLRLNYVEKVTSLITKMLKTNYKVLGLSEEQAKIYLDNLKSGGNDSVKAAGEILDHIRNNGDKFVTNNGQSVDLRPLGFGVILGPSKGYELGFLGTDFTNKDAMLSLVQSAIRYDVVLIAHGSSDIKSDDKDENDFLDDIKKADSSYHNDQEEIINSVGSLSKDDRQDVYAFINLYKTYYNANVISEIDGLDYFIEKELSKIMETDSSNRVKLFRDLIQNAIDKFYKLELKSIIKDAYASHGDKVVQDALDAYAKYKEKYIIPMTKITFAETVILLMKNVLAYRSDDAEAYWSCQPTRTLKAGPFEDINDLVRQLIKEGYKKILIKDCNPGNHELDEDIMKTKGVIINYSDFSNFVESSFDNDPDMNIINEAELSLREFAESYNIDYNNDEYLEECCQWYLENCEMIHEGIVDNLKEFFKRIVAAIIGFFKNVFRLIKKAFIRLKALFLGTKEEPKDTKTKFPKPIKTNMIDIDSKKVVELISESREDLNQKASVMCTQMSQVIKKLNNRQNNSLKKLEQDINKLSPNTQSESTSFIDFSFLLEDTDLLDTLELLREFEDANGPVTDDEEDSDFSMGDEGGEATPAEAQPEPAQEEPVDDEQPEDEEFSMDDEGEPETAEEAPEEEPVDDEQPEDEDYEIPDEEGEQTGEEPAPAEDVDTPEDEDFSMDDAGDGTEGGDSMGDTTDDSMTDNTPSDDNIDPRLKELESIIFDDLNEEEKKLKIKDLKELYITVYKKCGSITELLTDIKRDEETIQIVEYISNTLIDLKQYVNDYLNDIFDTKTYVENLAQLQKYIMIFNAINKVFDQIKQENNQ